jgi:Xaa-Pro aminopeptidase
MEEYDLDVLIASYAENVSYLSDLQSHMPYMYRFFDHESFALFPRRGDIAPALILTIGDVSLVARYPSWIKEVYTFGYPYYTINPEGNLSEEETQFKKILDDQSKYAPSAGEAIVKALKQKGLDKGKIGFDEKYVSPMTREYVKNSLPNAKFVDVFELFRIIRMVKTPEEIERLKTVGLLNERAAMAIVNRVAEGISEDELTQQFLESVAQEGAIFDFWQTLCGTQSSLIMMTKGHTHPRPKYRLKKGDMVRWDGGSIYNLYHSDAGGCAVIGTPNQRQKICYSAIEAGMERAMELLRPGILPSKIFEETVAAVEKAGLKEFPKMAYFVGHGIGIEPRDYPIFTRPRKAVSPFLPGSYDLPIEENMVISIEVPYVREFGLGGFQIEYTLLVKKDGCEKLYPHKRDLVIR